MVRLLLLLLFSSCMATAEVVYTADMLPLVIQDLYEELSERGDEVDFEQLEEDLLALHDNPINLNTATADDLRRLPFLSEQQIDAILLLAYKRPLQTLYELKLVGELADYEIRNLLPFVTVAPPPADRQYSWRTMLRHPRQQLLLRADARAIEDNGNDPLFMSVKYRLQCGRHLEAGIVAERDPHEPLYSPHKTYGADFYGGYLQLRDIGRLRTLVLGDYRASFGQGLVISDNFIGNSKIANVERRGFVREGLTRKSSTAEYAFLRGAGVTVSFGMADLTAFYSARKVDGDVTDGSFPSIQQTGYHRTAHELECKRTVWQQVAGVNLSMRFKGLRLGVTFTENILSDTLAAKPNYYNATWFRGTHQASLGLSYQYQHRLFSLFGEAAVSENRHWGVGNIIGIGLQPTSGLHLVVIHRYYSPYMSNMLAHSLSASSRQTDEHGLLLGADVRNGRWHLIAYADLYRYSLPHYGHRTPAEGYDIMLRSSWQPSEILQPEVRLRSRCTDDDYTHSLRVQLTAAAGGWKSQTIIEGNMTHGNRDSVATTAVEADEATPHKTLSFGTLIAQQGEYSFRFPLTVQARLEAFYAPRWGNRLYVYENDVLYAMNIPAVYGVGIRYYVNLRYKINRHLSLYLKASQTFYSSQWRQQHPATAPHRTDIHALLKVNW